MKSRVLGFLAFVVAASFISGASAATYQYSGVPDLTGSGYVRATVEVNCGIGPCAAGTYLYSSGITSYSLFGFAGNVTVATASSTDPNTSQDGFNVYMIFDGAGQVTNWFLLLENLVIPNQLIYTVGNDIDPPSNCLCGALSEDFSRDAFNPVFSITQDHPGTWRLVATSAVPEPATWAMMILGFCGLGLMAYRRKSPTVRAA